MKYAPTKQVPRCGRKSVKEMKQYMKKAVKNVGTPLLLHPWYKGGNLFFCIKCYAINPMYRKEDRYYQDILARFE